MKLESAYSKPPTIGLWCSINNCVCIFAAPIFCKTLKVMITFATLGKHGTNSFELSICHYRSSHRVLCLRPLVAWLRMLSELWVAQFEVVRLPGGLYHVHLVKEGVEGRGTVQRVFKGNFILVSKHSS